MSLVKTPLNSVVLFFIVTSSHRSEQRSDTPTSGLSKSQSEPIEVSNSVPPSAQKVEASSEVCDVEKTSSVKRSSMDSNSSEEKKKKSTLSKLLHPTKYKAA